MTKAAARILLSAATVLPFSFQAFGEKVDGEPGAVFKLRESGIVFSMVVDVPPGPRMAALNGDMFPSDETGEWKFRFGAAANGVNPEIDGTLKTAFSADGSVRCEYRMVCGRDCEMFDIFASGRLPNGVFAGGKVVADGRNIPLAAEYSGKGCPFAGKVSSLEFHDAGGARRLSISYPAPRKVAVKDSRSWGREGFVLYQYLLERRAVAKGERLECSFTLRGADGDRLEPAFDRRVVRRGADWIPAVFDREILAGSACDFSEIAGVDAPAGKHGWIVSRGGDFEFEKLPGVRQRFYGNNICWAIPMASREKARRLARELHANGYNAIRLHYWDIMMTDGVADGTTIPQDRLAAFDGFAKEMIDAGIYIATDLYTSRRVPWRELGIERDGNVPMDTFKQLLLVHAPAADNLEKYVRQLLTHVNPLTGRDYAHEPGLAWFCLVNEGNAGNMAAGSMAELPGCVGLWKKWIKEKKSSDVAYAGVGEAFPKSFRGLDMDAAAARQFLRFLETRFDLRMKSFVRSLGSRAMVSSMNHWSNPPGFQLVREDVYDFVDDHFYIDHPQFLGANRGFPTRCSAINPMKDGRLCVPHVVSHRLLDKPFTVTEYNWSAPGRFRGAGGLVTGTFAAMQNWSGVWRFCFGKEQNRIEDPNPYRITFHDTWSDPLMRAGEYVFSALFLRGDMPPLENELAGILPRNRLESLHVEPVDTVSHLPWAALAWRARTGMRVTDAASGWKTSFPAYPETYSATLDEARKRMFPAQAGSVSQTVSGCVGRTVWIDETAGTFAVCTPRTCGIFAERGKLSAGALEADVGDVSATVWAVSVDGRPLPESGRILVAHLTDVQDEGTEFVGEDVACLVKWGKPPHLMRRGSAHVSLQASGTPREVWALSSGGRRLARIPAHASGGRLEFVADVARDAGSATWFYEVVSQ